MIYKIYIVDGISGKKLEFLGIERKKRVAEEIKNLGNITLELLGNHDKVIYEVCYNNGKEK